MLLLLDECFLFCSFLLLTCSVFFRFILSYVLFFFIHWIFKLQIKNHTFCCIKRVPHMNYWIWEKYSLNEIKSDFAGTEIFFFQKKKLNINKSHVEHYQYFTSAKKNMHKHTEKERKVNFRCLSKFRSSTFIECVSNH